MIVSAGYIGCWAETSKAVCQPAMLMMKDMATRWRTELVEAMANIVKVRSTVNEAGSNCFLKNVYVPPRQSKAKEDFGTLECERNTIMGGDINWRPQQYVYIDGIATEDPDKVSDIAGMNYKTTPALNTGHWALMSRVTLDEVLTRKEARWTATKLSGVER